MSWAIQSRHHGIGVSEWQSVCNLDPFFFRDCQLSTQRWKEVNLGYRWGPCAWSWKFQWWSKHKVTTRRFFGSKTMNETLGYETIWVQQRVQDGDHSIKKVFTEKSSTDVGTKPVSADVLQQHCKVWRIGILLIVGQHFSWCLRLNGSYRMRDASDVQRITSCNTRTLWPHHSKHQRRAGNRFWLQQTESTDPPVHEACLTILPNEPLVHNVRRVTLSRTQQAGKHSHEDHVPDRRFSSVASSSFGIHPFLDHPRHDTSSWKNWSSPGWTDFWNCQGGTYPKTSSTQRSVTSERSSCRCSDGLLPCKTCKICRTPAKMSKQSNVRHDTGACPVLTRVPSVTHCSCWVMDVSRLHELLQSECFTGEDQASWKLSSEP